ncbi:aminopeptidase N [Lignipirellula cremea]|uniref:Aminopeptidase N n=1 Tax=Lignipirellula cremea TaxID=2528010 RepID=A0A518E4H3_9BACT|nr:aminopeptidase N [Lignipirellula cremea]QDU99005.1 Aminopeptidase N [Lignipirellula cremea]
MSTQEKPVIVYRKDYTRPAYWIDDVALEFDLEASRTLVTAHIRFRRNADQPGNRLELDGEGMELQSIHLDGEPLAADQYAVSDTQLIIENAPDSFLLTTQVLINPEQNKSLSGLYLSSGNFCTQCEALGFRHITYYLDRPDVMAKFQVTIRGNVDACPVMLSNGNRISQSMLADGRQQAVWEDPFPKPCYLFALVAGNLKCQRGSFTTRSGRQVELEIWVEPENIDKCEHALASLQKSMKWDEDVYGLEYDLDIYMIVAVNDFNMGAMENKGLNVFNSKYVLASPATATDDDYLGVEAVIAHEYFHNWTGNRVTCRDWFQLTLKEGLTVFRDQQFTSDQISAAVKRIDDVVALRSHQFPQDAGPMAHPIRPESYIAMDNFYTATVYNKGAEIIRIYQTLLGQAGFRRGMDLYFQRHDNSAVTCNDFRAAMADANDTNLDLLERWYSQPGTPTLKATGEWQADQGQYVLTLEQSYPPLPDGIPGASDRLPPPLPVAIGLLDSQGNDMPVRLAEGEPIASDLGPLLLLEEASRTFTFTGLAEEPVVSLLRNFSAPVKLKMACSQEELAFLAAHDSDAFNRWDAGQSLSTNVLLDLAERSAAGEALECPAMIHDAFAAVLADESIDDAFKALVLTLPGEGVLGQEMTVWDPEGIHAAREFVRKSLAERHEAALRSRYDELASDAVYRNDERSINRRRLKNRLLSYLAVLERPETTALVASQYQAADNMTDKIAALSLLADLDCPQRESATADFYQAWHRDPLVLDKWFAVQAGSRRSDVVEQVKRLTQHEKFAITNPNRVRSLLGAFAANACRFHDKSGVGYALLADYILQIDANNPQLASRLVSAFNTIRRFDKERQSLMQAQLERIQAKQGLSSDVLEIVERALKF